jgi:GntR family transcriptional regulator, transcriptional repressor for pyruvate dehydrogenase complex
VESQVSALPELLHTEPARNGTVMETVARRIEGLIRSGELRVGSRLPPEPKLAAMLGVSRSSLREGLKGLMFLGLIKARPGYGTYVQSSLGRSASRHFQWMVLLQEVKFLELYELRKILEPTVAALAARRANAEDLERMETAIRGMKANFGRPEQYMACEMAFHDEFARAAKNAAVETTLRMMYDALAEGRRRTLPLIDDYDSNWRRHERIFSLIMRRHAAGARRAVLDDLKYAETLLRRDLEAQEKFRSRIGDSQSTRPKIKRKAPSRSQGVDLKRG